MRGIRRGGYAAVGLLAVAAAGLFLILQRPAGVAPGDVALAPVGVADRPLRLAVLGTSVTARYAWPRELAAALSACLPHPVEVGVFARPGMGSAWGETIVSEAVRFDPDIVLIEFVGNDSDLRHLRSIDGSRATHRRLIGALRAGGRRPSIALMTMNPAFGLRGLARPRMAAFHAMYRELAREADVGLIDTIPRWHALLATADRRTLLPDGLHPTDDAQSRVMLDATVPMLAAAVADAHPACAGLIPAR
jgi:lysophospholipase L1-like esterase